MSLLGRALSPVSFESPQETAFPKQPLRWPVRLLSPSAKKISAPAAPNKASINSILARAARGTKSPTLRPSPQTSLETNVAGICQNKITRSMSLHTFTYLSAYSGSFQKGNINRERSDTISIATTPRKNYGCPSKGNPCFRSPTKSMS